MTKNQPITYKTALLALKAGIVVPINIFDNVSYYNYKGVLRGDSTEAIKHRKDDPNEYANIPAPTQYLLKTIIRGKYNIHIHVPIDFFNNKVTYSCGLVDNRDNKFIEIEVQLSKYGTTYYEDNEEDALEKGLQAALILLINEGNVTFSSKIRITI